MYVPHGRQCVKSLSMVVLVAAELMDILRSPWQSQNVRFLLRVCMVLTLALTNTFLARVHWMSKMLTLGVCLHSQWEWCSYANWALRMRDGLVRGRQWLLTKHEYFEFHSRVVLCPTLLDHVRSHLTECVSSTSWALCFGLANDQNLQGISLIQCALLGKIYIFRLISKSSRQLN